MYSSPVYNDDVPCHPFLSGRDSFPQKVAELSVAAAEVNNSGVRSLEPLLEGFKKAVGGSNVEQAEGALNAMTHFIKECPVAEPYMASLLPIVLKAASHKAKNVQKAATITGETFAAKMSPNAVAAVLPDLFAYLDVGRNWQTRVLALNIITSFSDHASHQLGYNLPEVVPALTPCIGDTKKQVKTAAVAAMTAACDVIGNRDMEHMTTDIVKAVINPGTVPEIMHHLASVAFVQSVESPALAMVVPLLLRGLRVKETATKRQSAVIIENMSKLVDEPTDAAPFLPLLMPALEKAAGTIANPEARGIADRALAQLMRLDGLCKISKSKKSDMALVSFFYRDRYVFSPVLQSITLCRGATRTRAVILYHIFDWRQLLILYCRWQPGVVCGEGWREMLGQLPYKMGYGA